MYTCVTTAHSNKYRADTPKKVPSCSFPLSVTIDSFCLFSDLMYLKKYRIFSFVSGFFHSTRCIEINPNKAVVNILVRFFGGQLSFSRENT